MKIRIAFYRHSKTLFWKLIRRQQRVLGLPEKYARYSHAEIVFMYDEKIKKHYNHILDIQWGRECISNYGLSFSSSEMDGWCRFKAIEWNYNNWNFVDIEVTREEYIDLLKFCRKENWNKYNTIWIFFAQILNYNKKRKGTWFCSEIVTRALQEIWKLCTLNSLFTNPWELAQTLEDSWYTITY